eukprot:jgi/Psemu1/52461/gm1.52461_g
MAKRRQHLCAYWKILFICQFPLANFLAKNPITTGNNRGTARISIKGLSWLFVASGLEKVSFGSKLYLSDQMGLFLQKTNIIRNYLKDYVDGCTFWPQSVWKKQSKTGELGYFADQTDPDAKLGSLECLNELVTDALELAPGCLVMAIATLNYCYNNSNVFTGVVKIQKGTSCHLILRTHTLDEVHDTFYQFARGILQKAAANRSQGVLNLSYSRTVKICATLMELSANRQSRKRSLG